MEIYTRRWYLESNSRKKRLNFQMYASKILNSISSSKFSFKNISKRLVAMRLTLFCRELNTLQDHITFLSKIKQ